MILGEGVLSQIDSIKEQILFVDYLKNFNIDESRPTHLFCGDFDLDYDYRGYSIVSETLGLIYVDFYNVYGPSFKFNIRNPELYDREILKIRVEKEYNRNLIFYSHHDRIDIELLDISTSDSIKVFNIIKDSLKGFIL